MIPGMHLTPIGNGNILLEPGEALDPGNPDVYLTPLAAYLQENNACHLIYDLGKIPVIDSLYYRWLETLNSLCQVCKVRLVTVNMQPAAAFALAQILKETPPFSCARNVDSTR